MQGKCITTFSIAEKTAPPCSSTHSKKVRGKNIKPIFPSISYRMKQLLPAILEELEEHFTAKKLIWHIYCWAS